MLEELTALSEPARWRVALLLAERPRSVGVVAELAGLRQPQATKHLQTLERAGIAVSRRSGQRRIYALQPDVLRALAAELERMAALAAGSRALFDQHAAAVDREILAADRPNWADGRAYVFHRDLPAAAPIVWRHLAEPELLSLWWAPEGLRLAELKWGARPGERLRQVYVDADGPTGDDVMGEAVGVIGSVDPGRRLSFVLSPRLPDGSVGFEGHYDWEATATASGTRLVVRLRIEGSAVLSAEFIAGIDLGWNQSLDRLALLLEDTVEREGTHVHE